MKVGLIVSVMTAMLAVVSGCGGAIDEPSGGDTSDLGDNLENPTVGDPYLDVGVLGGDLGDTGGTCDGCLPGGTGLWDDIEPPGPMECLVDLGLEDHDKKEPVACTYSQVYWKTHPGEWPVAGQFGISVDPRLGWLLMELPATISFLYFYSKGPRRAETVPLVFLAMWCIHYANRGFFFSLSMRVARGQLGSFSALVMSSGWLVTSFLSLPAPLVYAGVAAGLPLFGGISAYVSASVLAPRLPATSARG